MQEQTTPPRRKLSTFARFMLLALFLSVLLLGCRAWLIESFTVHQENGWHPEWSPDGQQIVFASNFDRGVGTSDVYVMNADGSDRKQLTFDPWDPFHLWYLFRNPTDDHPAWSPDGKQIAFVSGRTGPLQIYSMDADGSNIRWLTKLQGNTEPGAVPEHGHPVWSPDGQTIALLYSKDLIEYPMIYLIQADGTDIQLLIEIANMPSAANGHLSWSPDGRYLSFVEARSMFDDIYIVDVANREKKRLRSNFLIFSNTAWSPDGKTILFVGMDMLNDSDTNEYFYTITPDGAALTKVKPYVGNSENHVSWSPDGRQIVFDNGVNTIYRMDADGSNLVQLTKQ